MPKSKDTVFFNMLMPEFIADLLWFSEKKDQDTYNYIHSKYLRIHEYMDGNWQVASYYNDIYKNNKANYPITKYLKEASLGAFFLMFHEYAHDMDINEFAEKYIQEMCTRFPETDFPWADNMEIRCDFLAMFFSMDFLKTLYFSKEDCARMVALSLVAVHLFNGMKNFATKNINDVESFCTDLNRIVEQLTTRIKGLFVLMSYGNNSFSFFNDIDELHNVLEFLKSMVIRFMDCQAEWLLSLNEKKIKEIQSYEFADRPLDISDVKKMIVHYR